MCRNLGIEATCWLNQCEGLATMPVPKNAIASSIHSQNRPTSKPKNAIALPIHSHDRLTFELENAIPRRSI
ncbi:MAG: hypothetical protein DCF22_01395 [Leptolyngbya sp.]|nr:MAG: hypothetical protein DCF22_01395 [Leptolyngbya sp.]